MLKSPDRWSKTSHFTSLSEFRREQTLDGNKMAQHTVQNIKLDSPQKNFFWTAEFP